MFEAKNPPSLSPKAPGDKPNSGPWSRDPDLGTEAERYFIIDRLFNLNKSAEGPTLPPAVTLNQRVQASSGLRVVKEENFEGMTVLTVAWDQFSGLAPYQPSYRVRVTGSIMDTYYSVTGSPARVTIPNQGRDRQVTISLETRLSNGLVASPAYWPQIAYTISPPESYTRAISAAYSCTTTDRVILADITNPYTLTLCSIDELSPGFEYTVIVTAGAGPLTIAGSNTAQTVNGAASQTTTVTVHVLSHSRVWWMY